jgi:hypothetical protein
MRRGSVGQVPWLAALGRWLDSTFGPWDWRSLHRPGAGFWRAALMQLPTGCLLDQLANIALNAVELGLVGGFE